MDGKCRPLSVLISAGQASDPTSLVPLLEAVRVGRPTTIHMDRAYGARKYRRALRARKIRCVCPERQDARKARLRKGRHGGRPPKCDAEAYQGRQVVDRGINRLKDFRAIATRDEKRGHQF